MMINMSDERIMKLPQEKPFAVAVVRIGSHPLVYSVLIMLAVGITAFFVGIVPMVRMLQPGGKASVADAQTKKDSAQAAYDEEKKLATAAASITAEDRALMAYALPTDSDAPNLAVILKSMAARSGVRMSSFDISEPAAGSTATNASVGQISISMSLDLVTYDRLKIFLTNAENSLRIFDLKSYTYSPASGSMTVQFNSFYLSKT
jgi:hypothetical protein